MVRCGHNYMGRRAHLERSALPYSASTNYRYTACSKVLACISVRDFSKTALAEHADPTKHGMLIRCPTILGDRILRVDREAPSDRRIVPALPG